MDDTSPRPLATGDAATAALLATLRAARDHRRAQGQDTTPYDQLLADLEPLGQDVHDLAVIEAIRAATDQHGPGPYPTDDLAAIAGVTVDEARRAMTHLTAAGLAWPTSPPAGE